MKNSAQKVIPFPNYSKKEELQPDPAFAVSEVELVYKTKCKASERPVVSTSRSVYEILLSVWDDNKLDLVEQFNILLLNRANRVIGLYRLSTGGITSTVADPRLAFVTALKANATSMILSHNHPSGNLNPSREDETLTRKFKQAGELLDIKVLDHIIMTRDGYTSFADQGIVL